MSKVGSLAIGVSIVVSSLFLVGCGSNTTTNQNVQLVAKTSQRSVNYLTANSDFSLYRFDEDIKDSNTSKCYNTNTSQCATVWPPYYVETLTAIDTANGLSNFTRTDGRKQTSYFGYPLYIFKNDIDVGDINGNFVHNEWNLIYPKIYDIYGTGTSLSLSKINEKYLVDAKGFSLYTFDDDNIKDISNCYDIPNGVPCATIWPPFDANITATNISNDLNISLFNTVQRTDGKKQISYNGKPLYHFAGITAKNIAGDTKASDTNGDWFKKGDWHLVQIK